MGLVKVTGHVIYEHWAVYAAITDELSGRIDRFFAAYANPKWDLWRGGTVKSNSTRPFLWKEAWGEDWSPVC